VEVTKIVLLFGFVDLWLLGLALYRLAEKIAHSYWKDFDAIYIVVYFSWILYVE